MTNEEAAALVADVFDSLEHERGTGEDWSEEHEARDMAIRALLNSSEKPSRSGSCRKIIAQFKKRLGIKSPSAKVLGYEYEYDHLKAER